MEAVRVAQASEAARISNAKPSAAAIGSDSNTTATSDSSREPFRAANLVHLPRYNQPSADVRNLRSKQPNNKAIPGNQIQFSPPRVSASTHECATACDPPANSRTVEVAVANQSVSNHSERAPTRTNRNLSNVICFWCGKQGHISTSYIFDSKPPRWCFTCGGICHLARVYPNPGASKPSLSAELKPKSSNAVESAGTGAPQLFANAVIDGSQVREALVDTCSAY